MRDLDTVLDEMTEHLPARVWEKKPHPNAKQDYAKKIRAKRRAICSAPRTDAQRADTKWLVEQLSAEGRPSAWIAESLHMKKREIDEIQLELVLERLSRENEWSVNHDALAHRDAESTAIRAPLGA